MAIIQSIDSALEKNIGPHGVADDVLERRAGARRGRARRLARAPRRRQPAAAAAAGDGRTTSPPSATPPRRLARGRQRHRHPRHRRLQPRRPDAGAAGRLRRAGRRLPARRAAPAFHGQSRSAELRDLLARLPLATTRFVAISKSGGTGETLMQTIAALSALKQAGLDARTALPRHQRAGQGRQAQRPARSARPAHQVPMLDHDPGVGGRFSVLTNVGLLPAAVLGLDIAAIREGAGRRAGAGAGEETGGRGAGRARRRAVGGAGREQGQEHQRADGLCRPAGALHALVCAALGRKPRQGRQGHHADRGARPGRPAQPAAAVHRRAARQTVHRRHRRRRRAGAAHRRRTRQARRRAGLRRQDHRRSGGGARPRHRRDAGQERLPGAHAFTRRGSTRRASANC